MKHRFTKRITLTITFSLLLIYALSLIGCSEDDPASPEATPPTTPTNITISAGNDTLSVSWDAVTNATSYKVYWNTTGDVDTADSTIVASQPPLRHTGLTYGTPYYYRVSAVNADGESGLSTQVSTTPMPDLPNMPTGCYATPGNGYVTVSWQAVAGATGYRVYWDIEGSVDDTDSMIADDESPFRHTDLDNETPYYYRFSAVNLTGESGLSAQVSATPTAAAPDAPTGVSADADDAAVTVSWDFVPGAVIYRIYWDTEGSVDDTDMSFTSAAQSYNHTELTNGTPYFYRVSAVNIAGNESDLSSQVTATPTGSSGIRLIACGDNTSFLVTAAGDLYAWGENDYGQLGIGSFTQQRQPVLVSGVSDVVEVDASRSHTVVLTGSGQAYAWGQNEKGELGDGTSTTTWWPTPVSGPTDFVDIAAARLHSMGVTTDGTVWVWGANSDGQLGLGHDDAVLAPAPISGIFSSTGFVVAGYNSCFYKPDYSTNATTAMYSWGGNSGGVLGRGDDLAFPYSPGTIAPTTKITAAATRLYHSLALREDHTVLAWGVNAEGQLGTGSYTGSSWPIAVNLVSHVTAVAAGYFHSLALGDDGRIMAWGGNGFGQLGDGTWIAAPTRTWVSDLTSVEKIAAGGSHNLAVRSDGTVWAWGSNTYGQLGDNSVVGSNVPIRVIGY